MLRVPALAAQVLPALTGARSTKVERERGVQRLVQAARARATPRHLTLNGKRILPYTRPERGGPGGVPWGPRRRRSQSAAQVLRLLLAGGRGGAAARGWNAGGGPERGGGGGPPPSLWGLAASRRSRRSDCSDCSPLARASALERLAAAIRCPASRWKNAMTVANRCRSFLLAESASEEDRSCAGTHCGRSKKVRYALAALHNNFCSACTR